MTITQTVDIPASHKLTIEVPREVPEGRAVLSFTPASPVEECPFCAAHRDPVTGNPLYKPEVYASMREVDDMLSGKIPSTLKWHTSLDDLDEMLGL